MEVNIDYHVTVEHVFYSVPYNLIKKRLDVRISEHIVEIFHSGTRVASHPRSHRAGVFITTTAHMPASHQAYQEWTPQRLVQWAEQAGGATADVVKTTMATRAHPQQGFRSCLGIMNLSKRYSPQRLEAACTRALLIGSPTYRSIRSILDKKLEQTPVPAKGAPEEPAPAHQNIRGATYYQGALTPEVDHTKGNSSC